METENNTITSEGIENSQLQSTGSRDIPLYKKVVVVLFFQTASIMNGCLYKFDSDLINFIKPFFFFPCIICELFTKNQAILAITIIACLFGNFIGYLISLYFMYKFFIKR